ncbi:MAG: GNAT family N-acetyltransferase [Acidobacteria bacterium]|nr:GNAT family N-acetyltransferase [Acidobacteriota bacterium]
MSDAGDVTTPQVALLSDGVIALRRPEPVDGPSYLQMRNNLALVSAVMGFRLGVNAQTVDAWIASGGGVEGDDLMLTAVLAKDAQRPVGYIKAYRVDRVSRHAWVGLSLFDERDAGRGYGRRMLTQVCDYLRDFVAVRKVSLEVLAGNARALALYASLGFAEEGRLKAQYFTHGRFEDVVILSKFLAAS